MGIGKLVMGTIEGAYRLQVLLIRRAVMLGFSVVFGHLGWLLGIMSSVKYFLRLGITYGRPWLVIFQVFALAWFSDYRNG